MSELEQRFSQLAARWRTDTRHISSVKKMSEHSAYREIVAMGEPAVPLILRELQREPDHWFVALYEITGEQPEMRPEDAGYFDKAVEAWIEWGKSKGYLPLTHQR